MMTLNINGKSTRVDMPNWLPCKQPMNRKEGRDLLMKRFMCVLAVLVLSLPMLALAAAAAEVFEVTGAIPDDIQATVDAFRAFLGTNNGVGGSFPDGRREINWDAVPDSFAAPNLLPADFFNVNSPRGVVFFTTGTGFQVSANSVNPTNTPVLFGDIHPVLPHLFSTFSPERLFTALGSNITEILFFVPGTARGARVDGFGAVFTDVNNDDSTKIEYFDVNGRLLFSRNVLPGPTHRGSLSFLGIGFATPEVFLVRITSGNRILKVPNRGHEPLSKKRSDVVVMDDFIYGEPQPSP
jgi:hypothetical protein